MATEDKTQSSSAEPSRVETEVAKPQVSSVTIGKDGPEATTHDELSNSRDLGGGLEPDLDDEEGGVGDEDQGSDEGDKKEGDEDGAESDSEALPDYDPENEEVRAAYDARYFKDGVLDKGVISSEYWKSFEANKGDLSKAGLSEGTYAYLKDTLGVSKEMAKEIEAGLVAKHTNDEASFFSKFGGVERYNRAITWAKDGGYTAEQQQRFREAYAKGGDDRDDAVDALMNRFHRNTGGQKDGRRGPPGRRSSSPQRDATGSTASQTGGGDRFKDASEHQAASTAARKAYKDAEAAGDRDAMKKASDLSKSIYQKARRGYARR